jgi:hypothetical protein
MKVPCVLVDHPNVNLNALNILPHVPKAIESAESVIDTSVDFKHIDCPIQLVCAVLDLIGDRLD